MELFLLKQLHFHGTPDMGINQEVKVLYTPGSGKY